jgi:threonine dehydratase
LGRHFAPTPLVRAASLSRPGRDVYLKVETGLPTGSFKVRGAVYSLSVNVARCAIHEVVAASTGNHGAAVAYAGRLLGIPATIFLPTNPNPVKAARIRELGARIVEGGAVDLSAAIDAAYEYCERTNAFFLHDAADPDIPAGTATIAAEIVDQLPSVDAIYVPMGDTALVRGMASVAKRLDSAAGGFAPRRHPVRIVGVAAERAPAYALAWRSGEATETTSADTIADGLAVRRALTANVAAIRTLVDDVRTVTEEGMLGAIDWLMTREGVTAEPAGAAATAAFLQEMRLKADTTYEGASVLLVTGCNIAPEIIASVDALRRRGPAPPP